MAPGEPAQRVGESAQDTMGFTVVGDDAFIGSGHPDLPGFEEGQPSRLGLIESTDSGRSWRTLSLSGEADFHALVAAHDRIYGWDATSSRLMVSTDGREWDVRSTLDLSSFAVDPDDAEHLVAVAPGENRVSDDGGRTWTSPASPEAVVVSWAPGGVVWIAGPGGELHRSDDRAATWIRVGSIGDVPQALLATGDDLWVATVNDADVTSVLRSADEGATWEVRYRGSE